jgi:ATP citrate (pro-S)-lyase
LTQFIREIYEVYKSNYFTYLEINPVVVADNQVHILDLAAKLDETAYFLCSESWTTRKGEPVAFPAPFGRERFKEVSRHFLNLVTILALGEVHCRS